MKNISIKVPPNGTTVELIMREGASSGQAVIVASDDVEIRVKGTAPIADRLQSQSITKSRKTIATTPQAANLDLILKRLIKLKPTKRDAAVIKMLKGRLLSV